MVGCVVASPIGLPDDKRVHEVCRQGLCVRLALYLATGGVNDTPQGCNLTGKHMGYALQDTSLDW